MSGVSLEAVCTIFETLNNTGVRLSVFDLLSARYFAEGRNLRELWIAALDKSKHLADFQIDPYYILQVICAHLSNSIKRSDVLKLKSKKVVEVWDDAIWGMEETLAMLHHECGVLNPNWLSYNTILIPLAAIFMRNRSLIGAAVGFLRTQLKKWFWCSVFGQTYESNPTSQTITDIGQFQTWLEGGQEPQSVKRFSFDKQDLYQTTTKQRAIYRGLMCLIVRTPSLDFHSTQPITASLLEESHIDDHHIFPHGYLLENPPSGDKAEQVEIDCILNRTLIDRETNQRIGKNPPSIYLGDIEKAMHDHSSDPAVLTKVLNSHHLPSDMGSSLRADDFRKFINERANTLYGLIEQATKYG
jgi:hypothetical protein